MKTPVTKFVAVPIAFLFVVGAWLGLVNLVTLLYQALNAILKSSGANVPALVVGLSLFILALVWDEHLQNRASYPLTNPVLR